MNSTEVSSSTKSSSSPRQQLLLIEVYVILTFIFLVVLFVLGQIRRRYRGTVLKIICLAVNASISLLISYIFGLMQNLDGKNELVFVWGVFLVVVYVMSVDVDIHDPASAGLAIMKLFLYSTYALSLNSGNQPRTPSSTVPLFVLLVISEAAIISKVRRVILFINPSCETRPLSFLWKLSKYNIILARNSHDAAAKALVINPNSIEVKDGKVSGEGGIVTMDKIWSCNDGSILQNKGDQLKSTSLSFSLFWMLVRRFGGYPPLERSLHQGTWRLVKHQSQDISSLLRVIEVELSFLYDFFSGRGFPFFIWGFRQSLVGHLVRNGIIGWILVALFTNYNPDQQKLTIQYHKYDLDVMATRVVISIIILIQLVSFYIVFTSKWSKMLLLCTYIKREAWKEQNTWDWCIKKAAAFLCLQRRRPSMPHQTKLRQYSLLNNGNSKLPCAIISLFLRFIGIPYDRPGRNEGDSINLSAQIKNTVIQPLIIEDLDPQLFLSNGSRALESIGALDVGTKEKLVEDYCSQLDSDTTEVILMWHIATTMCEMNPELSQIHRDSDDFHVATSLSKYCAYLVAFAPNLLPGHPSTTERTCTLVIEDGNKILGESEFVTHTYDTLLNMDVEGGLGGEVDTDSIFRRGTVLGRVLNKEIINPATRWKVVADVWAERLLYLAPNANNEWAHLDKLAAGGEFITHLWVLLFHVGIVNRESLHT